MLLHQMMVLLEFGITLVTDGNLILSILLQLFNIHSNKMMSRAKNQLISHLERIVTKNIKLQVYKLIGS